VPGPRPLDAAICAVGAAAPALRVDVSDVQAGWGKRGGRGQIGVCGADEDATTLAWLAATRALDAGGMGPDAVDGLWWGCTRPPFAEGPSWTHLAAALRLDSGCDGALLSGSTHAGIEALLAAADAVASGRVHTAVVVASDALLPALGSGHETSCGAGAAAVVVRREGPATLTAAASSWRPTLDRYRGDGEQVTREAYDPRLFREQVFLPLCTEVAGALTGDDPASERWALPDPDGRLGGALARRLHVGEVVSGPVRSELGDTGAAALLLGLGGAMDERGRLSGLAYGGGRATAIGIEVNEPVPGAERVAADVVEGVVASYTAALRARGQLRPQGEAVEMAVPPGSAMFVRGNTEVLGLLGARCRTCDTVNTPPSIHPSCIACGGSDFEDVPLPRGGSVQTFVVNQTMPAPFVAPLPLVVVDLDDGSRLMTQAVGDGADLEIGARVDLVLRRFTIERGVPIYGYKAVVVFPSVEVREHEERPADITKVSLGGGGSW